MTEDPSGRSVMARFLRRARLSASYRSRRLTDFLLGTSLACPPADEASPPAPEPPPPAPAPVQAPPDLLELARRLPHATTVPAFHQLLAEYRIVDAAPRFMHVEVDMSNKCNIRCVMCHFSFDHLFQASPVYFRPDTFQLLADSVLPHTQALMLALGNEPLMSPHFPAILSLAAPHQIPALGFYTNGLLLNDRAIDAVIHSGVTTVFVSIDGATKDTYESIRRGADFNRLIGNVTRLVARRAEAGGRLPAIAFAVTLMRRNIRELPDIVELAARLGVDGLSIFHLMAYEGLDMHQESLFHDRALSNECVSAAVLRARDLGLTLHHVPAFFTLDEQAPSPSDPLGPPPTPAPAQAQAVSPSEPRTVAGTPYCRFPFFHVSMDAGGQILLCPYSHGELPVKKLGPNAPFESIWFGPALTELRTRILTNDPPPMCRRCSFLASSHPDLTHLFDARTVTPRHQA